MKSSTFLARGAAPLRAMRTRPPSLALTLENTSLSKKGDACTKAGRLVIPLLL